MSEGADQVFARGARRIFRPPGQDMRPHSDHRLGEHIRVEAVARPRLFRSLSALSASGTDAFGQPLEDSRGHVTGLTGGMKEDAQQIALLVGKAHQDIGLGVCDVPGLGLSRGDLGELGFEGAGGFLREFAEEFDLVLEMEIKGSRGVSGLSGDRMGRDAARTVFGEEGPARLE